MMALDKPPNSMNGWLSTFHQCYAFESFTVHQKVAMLRQYPTWNWRIYTTKSYSTHVNESTTLTKLVFSISWYLLSQSLPVKSLAQKKTRP